MAKKNDNTDKKKSGCKGKYDKWISPDGLIVIRGWAREGLTEAQIAAKMKVGVSTLSEWKIRFPELLEAIKEDKEIPDAKVEAKLFDSTQGYIVTLQRPIKCKEIKYDENGRKCAEREFIVYTEYQEYVPPVPLSQIFWLKNRRPDKWRDKQEIQHSGEINNPMSGLTEAELRALANARVQR